MKGSNLDLIVDFIPVDNHHAIAEGAVPGTIKSQSDGHPGFTEICAIGGYLIFS